MWRGASAELLGVARQGGGLAAGREQSHQGGSSGGRGTGGSGGGESVAPSVLLFWALWLQKLTGLLLALHRRLVEINNPFVHLTLEGLYAGCGFCQLEEAFAALGALGEGQDWLASPRLTGESLAAAAAILSRSERKAGPAPAQAGQQHPGLLPLWLFAATSYSTLALQLQGLGLDGASQGSGGESVPTAAAAKARKDAAFERGYPTLCALRFVLGTHGSPLSRGLARAAAAATRPLCAAELWEGEEPLWHAALGWALRALWVHLQSPVWSGAGWFIVELEASPAEFLLDLLDVEVRLCLQRHSALI